MRGVPYTLFSLSLRARLVVFYSGINSLGHHNAWHSHMSRGGWHRDHLGLSMQAAWDQQHGKVLRFQFVRKDPWRAASGREWGQGKAKCCLGEEGCYGINAGKPWSGRAFGRGCAQAEEKFLEERRRTEPIHGMSSSCSQMAMSELFEVKLQSVRPPSRIDLGTVTY